MVTDWKDGYRKNRGAKMSKMPDDPKRGAPEEVPGDKSGCGFCT